MSMCPIATPVRRQLTHHEREGETRTKAEDLLKLELNGRSHLGELAVEVIGVRDGRRELASLGQTGSEQTRDLLNAVRMVSELRERTRGRDAQGIAGQESVVLLGELLDELLRGA